MRVVTSSCLWWAAESTHLSNGWIQADRLTDPKTFMTVRFALQKAEPAALEQALLSISDPTSAGFRQYLGDAEVAQLVRPRAGAAEAVESWVHSMMGEDSQVERSKHGDYISVSSTAAGVKQAFVGLIDNVASFQHEAATKSVVRAVTPPSSTPTSLVPSALKDHVSAVLDLIELLPVPPRQKLASMGQPGDTILPQILHKQYGMLDDPEAIGGRTETSQGVAMFEEAEFRQTDVTAFQNAYDLPNVEFQINGPNDGGYFGEAGLDTQWITATGRGVPSWWIARDSFDMLAWCEQVLNMTKPPSVVSISWGSSESNFQVEHLQAGSDCFQKMGVQGISVFTASGDEGTGKKGTFGCKGFDPDWPASCPYITSVGGTYLQSGTENGWASSGGGFSAVFPRPAWQDKVVAAYKQSATLPDSTLFAGDGAGKPDVAALCTNFQVFSAGSAQGTLTGTSAASPAFAGMVAVVNDLLADAGKPTVGFINPALYAAAESSKADFLGFDVTTGNNKHSGCKAGFPAVEGWDAVTGLGTPSFQKLKTVLMTGFGSVSV